MAIKSEASTNTTVRPARAISAEGVFVVVVTALLGLQMMFFGMWGLVWPHAAAEFVTFDISGGDGVHFVRDGGALSVGMGTALLLADLARPGDYGACGSAPRHCRLRIRIRRLSLEGVVSV